HDEIRVHALDGEAINHLVATAIHGVADGDVINAALLERIAEVRIELVFIAAVVHAGIVFIGVRFPGAVHFHAGVRWIPCGNTPVTTGAAEGRSASSAARDLT